MKILRDGKEVKNGSIIFDTTGRADLVEIDGVQYDAATFEIQDTKEEVKTKGSEEKSTKPATKKVAKKSK